MYDSEAKDALSLYVTCLDEDPQKNDLIGDCVINLSKVLENGEQDGKNLQNRPRLFPFHITKAKNRSGA